MKHLHLETDGSVDPKRSLTPPEGSWSAPGGAGIVLRTEAMDVVATYAVQLGFVGSALHAEYLALRLGMDKALEHGATALRARSDCLVMIRHLRGDWKISNLEFEDLATQIRHRALRLDPFELLWAKSTHAPRRRDGTLSADALAKIGSGVLRVPKLPPGVVLERTAELEGAPR